MPNRRITENARHGKRPQQEINPRFYCATVVPVKPAAEQTRPRLKTLEPATALNAAAPGRAFRRRPNRA